MLDYLAECFEKIGSYEDSSGQPKPIDADIALNLAGRGRRGPKVDPETREKSLLRGKRVHDEYRRTGQSIEQICARLAESEHQSQHTLERDYKIWISLF